MITFKNYWRLINYNKLTLIMPLIIFVGFSFLSKMQAQANETEYSAVIPDVAIVNHDSLIGEGLMEYLAGKVNLITVDEAKMEEALFYHQVTFTLVIPEDYTAQFLAGNSRLESDILPSSPVAYIAESLVNEYLGYYETFSRAGYDHETIQTMIMSAEARSPEITVLDGPGNTGNFTLNLFSRLSIYPIMITVMSVIPPVLMAFNQRKIKDRMMVSSTSATRKNLELLAGTLVFAHVLWILMMALFYLLIGGNLLASEIKLTLLNSYVFFLTVTSFAVFIGQMVKTTNGVAAITNSIGLGLSFISGIFVPRSVLSPLINTIAKLFPVYWNVEVYQLIYEKTATLSTMLLPIVIQLFYAVALLLLTLLVSRNKKNV